MEQVVLFLMLHVLLVYVLNNKIYTCDLFYFYCYGYGETPLMVFLDDSKHIF
jgi:hypothetical protein